MMDGWMDEKQKRSQNIEVNKQQNWMQRRHNGKRADLFKHPILFIII